ncbi:Transcriptional regulator MraZ [Thauera sp. GDN1]|uniref:division/cell wall cluster transcriptional repressor MraZ n=1 Tax=Thauera sp. GDN1 TaxID=2944810 RepID=UPI00247A8505|nr:division/cell wall cluster transcriptional repressor MraZ [Thauera sp. GDN1]WEN41219.1 Transcriptional regulator MraZ [Thauera sp. GDN1]
MFQGAAALNLDAKGRLAIPARHRDALAVDNGQIVLTAHPHGCCLVYPVPAWIPIRDQVLAAPGLDPQSAMLKRLLVGFAQDETLDAAGRVLVAPSLRKFAKLDKQVWLVGQGTHFELWSDEGWEKQQEAMLNLAATGLPPGFESLAL